MNKIFKVGGYVVNENGYFRKILVEIQGIYFLSISFTKEEAEEENIYGLTRGQHVGNFLTIDEMNAYFTPCTLEEAGMPVEAWEPKEGDMYWSFTPFGEIYENENLKMSCDIYRFKTKNCFRTREEVEARYKEIMGDE